MVGTYDERPLVIPLAKVTASFGLVTYVVARLLLLSLAFSSLRKLGPKRTWRLIVIGICRIWDQGDSTTRSA